MGYHVFYAVHNTKNYGIPQNRERIFIIGFRDEADALNFRQPKGFPLLLKLKDLLQDSPHSKYNLSENQNNRFVKKGIDIKAINPDSIISDRGKAGEYIVTKDIVGALSSRSGCSHDNHVVYEVPEKYYLSDKMLAGLISKEKGNQLGFINQDTQASKVSDPDSVFDTLCAGTHGYANGYVAVSEATKQGYAIADPGDSINLSVPTSTTRRGRVGKGRQGSG